MFGVQITDGPQDWQIFQQEGGFGEVTVSGRCVPREGIVLKAPQVFARIVREADGRPLSFWQKAQMDEARAGWTVSLKAPAGGLYRLETCLAEENEQVLEWATRGDMRFHLGVGDLYVIAGQSNSAGYSKDPAYDPPEPGVHLFRNCGRWDMAAHPMNDSTDIVHPANQEISNTGSCPYLAFGKMLRREIGHPIGFLQTSLGGSPLRDWDPQEDGRLYRSMMEVIRSQGGKIKGVLWYQGCTDAIEGGGPTYLKRFEQMVSAMRRELGQDVPFLTIQLNRQTGVQEADNGGYGLVREAQRQAAHQIPGVLVIPTLDYTLMSDGIHNSAVSNIAMGERLAAAALREIYGKPGYPAVPEIEKTRLLDEKTVELAFRNVQGHLFSYDLAPDISVWDEEGEVPAESWELCGDKIRLTLARPAKGACTAGGGWKREPHKPMPVDFDTHVPALAFYQFPVERAR